MTQKKSVIIFPVADGGKAEAVRLTDLDPHQLAWHKDQDGIEWLAATNGPETVVMKREGGKLVEQMKSLVGFDIKHRPTPLTFLPKSGRLLLAVNDKDAKQQKLEFYVSDMTVERKNSQWLLGHKWRPTCAAVSRDEQRIVTGDEGGTLIVWEGEKFEEKRRIEQGPTLAALALAPDGKTVAVLRSHGVDWLGALPDRSSTVFQLYVFDVTDPPAKPTPIWQTEARALPEKPNGPISLTFSPDGKTLLAAFADPYTDDTKKYGEIPKSMGVKVWELVPKK